VLTGFPVNVHVGNTTRPPWPEPGMISGIPVVSVSVQESKDVSRPKIVVQYSSQGVHPR
jgi:hypothetical protein